MQVNYLSKAQWSLCTQRFCMLLTECKCLYCCFLKQHLLAHTYNRKDTAFYVAHKMKSPILFMTYWLQGVKQVYGYFDFIMSIYIKKLTLWSRVLIEKLREFFCCSRNSVHVTKPTGSSPSSKEPTIYPCPNQLNSAHTTICV